MRALDGDPGTRMAAGAPGRPPPPPPPEALKLGDITDESIGEAAASRVSTPALGRRGDDPASLLETAASESLAARSSSAAN